MKVIRFEKPGLAALVDVPDPEPPAGWARVQVRAAAISMADMALLEGHDGARFPMTAGHAWCGTVEQVASGSDASWIGKKVTADSEITCLRCAWCRAGEWRRCPHYRRIGQGVPGAFAEYVLAPVHNLHALDDSLSFEQGALLEPLAVGLKVAALAQAGVGATAAVLGAGPIGLSVVAALKASGARRILCLDQRPRRLLLARSWGAHEIFGHVAKLKENAAQFHPDGTDVVVEASGDPELLRAALMLARFGGTVVLAGSFRGQQPPLAPDVIADRNLRVLGAGHHAGFVATAALAAGDGGLRTEEMITNRYRLEDWKNAFSRDDLEDRDYIQGVFVF